MGLIVSVYRDAGADCTNNGVSSRFDQFCVTNIPGPFEPREGLPPAQLVKGPMNSLRIVPELNIEANDWVMYGGNLASTCDSRFGEACEELVGYRPYGVGIFDRVER